MTEVNPNLFCNVLEASGQFLFVLFGHQRPSIGRTSIAGAMSGVRVSFNILGEPVESQAGQSTVEFTGPCIQRYMEACGRPITEDQALRLMVQPEVSLGCFITVLNG